jgi:hypothetical protein
MIQENMMVFAEKSFWGSKPIKITFFQKVREGVVAVGQPLTMIESPAYLQIEKPTLTLDFVESQALMDQLWDCGVRPTQGSGSAGSLLATEKHLEDMRKITSGLLSKHGVKL